MLKVKTGVSPEYVSELLQRSDTNYNLRNSKIQHDNFW